MSKDGGPAFPGENDHVTKWINEQPVIHQSGMSLRDYFAGQALAGLIRAKHHLNFHRAEGVAEFCYNIADAMLAERAKQEGA